MINHELNKLSAVITITKNDGEVFEIRKGDYIAIVTDDTDYDETYSGIITYIDEDMIQIDNKEFVPWFHITNIDKN